ncbi:MAG TPA: hypothetical protein VK935_02010, partial [Actinomycetospora sp.]|nr:hypothetical protein [Actinomycetospora sp.]
VNRPPTMAPQPAFAQPWQPGPPHFGPAGLPPAPLPARPGGGAGRIVAAIAALPFALFLALICVVGTVVEFAECSTRSLSCVAGTSALVGFAAAVGAGALAIAGLTTAGRRTARRAGFAWTAVGGGFVLLILTAAFGA